MATIRIAKTEAPFHAQTNGIDVGLLETEANSATGIVVTTVSTDATDIVFEYALTPPSQVALEAVVHAHDGRTVSKVRTVHVGLPPFEGYPKHKSEAISTAAASEKIQHYMFPVDCRLMGGRIWVGSEARLGDKITIQIVDLDGMTGAPPGTVLASPVDGVHVPPGGTGTTLLEFSTGQTMPMVKETYLRFTYHSDGLGQNVDVIAYWREIHDAP